MPDKFVRKVAVLQLTRPGASEELEKILNQEGVICDTGKDIQYFFDDRSCALIAVIFYNVIEHQSVPSPKTPKELLDEAEPDDE